MSIEQQKLALEWLDKILVRVKQVEAENTHLREMLAKKPTGTPAQREAQMLKRTEAAEDLVRNFVGLLADAEAERDRLGAALIAIRDHPEDEEWHTTTDRKMREIASEALAKAGEMTITHYDEQSRAAFEELRAENDRLRETLKRFNAEVIALNKRVEELRKAAEAENARLRGELDELYNERHLFVVDKERQRLAAENARLREALTWVSASTMEKDAPKWGEHFLIFRLGDERLGELAIQPDQIGIARYVPDDQTGWRLETNWQYGAKYGLSKPTHWVKIPTPPKAEEV